MRYRKLDVNGDYSFGHNGGDYLQNTPDTVAQAIKTRLCLWTGEWFLDTTYGVPYSSKVLGTGTLESYNSAIREAILNTIGVLRVNSFFSWVDPNVRKAYVVATVDTIYGAVTIQQGV